jgi:hypothetical protein
MSPSTTIRTGSSVKRLRDQDFDEIGMIRLTVSESRVQLKHFEGRNKNIQDLIRDRDTSAFYLGAIEALVTSDQCGFADIRLAACAFGRLLWGAVEAQETSLIADLFRLFGRCLLTVVEVIRREFQPILQQLQGRAEFQHVLQAAALIFSLLSTSPFAIKG